MPQPKTYTWISVWFLFSYTIVLWDLAYILIRPHSLEGGRFRYIWSVYDELEHFDLTYSPKYFYDGHIRSAALSAKGALSIPEVAFAAVYLFQVHISPSPLAPLFGFSAAFATFLKCALWTLEELYCGWCTTGHNSNYDIFMSWTLPTGVWILLSLLAALRLGGDVVSALRGQPLSWPSQEKNEAKALR
ncbi:hypothetical protein B0H34DRAFT_483633 [Crassisporium funariophilum]|nr:hypothetical protein B0H34DRAFT_483633 [Crassisporium funariophilum]